jgi:hypothetical protein
LDHSHVLTTPFSVTVVSDKRVAPVWWDRRLVADGPAGVVEPHPVFRQCPDRLDFQRVIVYPSSDGVSEELLLSKLAVDFHPAVEQLGE